MISSTPAQGGSKPRSSIRVEGCGKVMAKILMEYFISSPNIKRIVNQEF